MDDAIREYAELAKWKAKEPKPSPLEWEFSKQVVRVKAMGLLDEGDAVKSQRRGVRGGRKRAGR